MSDSAAGAWSRRAADALTWLRARVSVSRGKVQFALTPTWAVILVGGALLLVAVTYKLGTNRTPADVTPTPQAVHTPVLDPGLDVAAVRQSEPEPGVVDLRGKISPPPVPARMTSPSPTANDGGTAAGRPDAPSRAVAPAGLAGTTPQPGRMPGLNYIVVERFHTKLPQVNSLQDARRDAEEAQKWLAERGGLQTVIEAYKDGFQLVTVQGFKYSEQKRQCEDLRDQILKLGKQYSGEGHNYLFTCEIRKF